MLDMIRLLHGSNKYSYKEFEKFKPLDTICGDASAPDEIKIWSEKDFYSIEEAKKKAELGICYTQEPIDIFDREKEEVVSTLPWYGVQPGDDDEPLEEIGGGFYGQWVDL